nr:prepilin-type N-terminal cleavage/methylation domain-containing protein [Candidatus Gracilibacteria bacterium]
MLNLSKLKRSGFTLIEVLIAMSITLVLIVSLGGSFRYFAVQAQLSRARAQVDSFLRTLTVNALTGKSWAADYYGLRNSSTYQVGRYFLYIPVSDQELSPWEKGNYLIYGELQAGTPQLQETNRKGIKQIGRCTEGDYSPWYQISYVEKSKLDYPIFVQSLKFQSAGENDSLINAQLKKAQKGVLMVVDPPFARMGFFVDP